MGEIKNNKRILLGVTGCIAAYKSIDLVRLLVKDNFNVKVILTDNAQKFVTPLTFETLSKNKVYTNMFEDSDAWMPDHISLSDWADMFAIVPASANVISKVALGLADDLLTSTVLAYDGPLLLAASMNEKMYANEMFKENLSKLEKTKRIHLIKPEDGELACGIYGKGRLANIDVILETVKLVVKSLKSNEISHNGRSYNRIH